LSDIRSGHPNIVQRSQIIFASESGAVVVAVFFLQEQDHLRLRDCNGDKKGKHVGHDLDLTGIDYP
jgi:hypothetical protein